MNDKDLKRLMAQQVVIYMKLKAIEKKLEGSSAFPDRLITISEFERETERVLEKLNS